MVCDVSLGWLTKVYENMVEIPYAIELTLEVLKEEVQAL